MKFSSVVGVLAVVLVGALSGCVGGGATAGAKEVKTPDGAFDDSTGSIKGIVHTEELAPIAGAQVGIVGTKNTTTTDEAGGFALSYIQPGKVTLAIVALGYQSNQKGVDVAAGQATTTDIVLSPLPSLAPYSITQINKAVIGGEMVKPTPDCMYITLPGQSAATTKTCNGGNSCAPAVASCPGRTEVHYGHCGMSGDADNKDGCDLTPEWKTILGELAWTPNSGVTGRGWIFELLTPNVTRSGCPSNCDSGSVDQNDKHDWYTISSKSPIRHWVDDSNLIPGRPDAQNHPIVPDDRCGGVAGHYTPGHCDWAWRVFPGWCTIGGVSSGAAGCEHTGPDFAVDLTGNPVTVYFSYSVREPLPAGFTAVPDA